MLRDLTGPTGGREHGWELVGKWVEGSTSMFVLQEDFHEPARRAVTSAAAAESIYSKDPCFRSSDYATTSGIPFWTCVCVGCFEFSGADCLSSGFLRTGMGLYNLCVELRWIWMSHLRASVLAFNLVFTTWNFVFAAKDPLAKVWLDSLVRRGTSIYKIVGSFCALLI